MTTEYKELLVRLDVASYSPFLNLPELCKDAAAAIRSLEARLEAADARTKSAELFADQMAKTSVDAIQRATAAKAKLAQTEQKPPDAYAVRMSTGEWVGIWNSKEIAQAICDKQPESHQDSVVAIRALADADKSAQGPWAEIKVASDGETRFLETHTSPVVNANTATKSQGASHDE